MLADKLEKLKNTLYIFRKNKNLWLLLQGNDYLSQMRAYMNCT
jgi:hypothetical protein